MTHIRQLTMHEQLARLAARVKQLEQQVRDMNKQREEERREIDPGVRG